MRPYQGKRIDNGEWVEGWYIRYEHMGIVRHIIATSYAQIYANSHDVDPDTVRQDSGVPDKYGKPVFDGDILKVPDLYETPENTETRYHNELVTFEDGAFCADGTPMYDDAQYISDECEVIGNRWDHPHLLEVSDK
ncbi:hypothetical protein D3P07_11475 [Paenibacillus sp. 1011MAR3C5]|uniref:YopX family protein n=1 Tax=Paenibacillus sp. 1011MAR3C5 TaxID=1675787 RepID=UPI000E6C8308|nr:YopX family protein [Paenibacillus sp. 1011MAR3C5]RJE88608.1 hypothetical protein D3P07_11475 [Paenibacillus sp. 1011MAR3C5]